MKRLLLFLIFITGCTSGAISSDFEPDEESFIRIPLEDISSQMAKYTYDAGGVKVQYFAVLGSDGEVRTAFDACDVCGGYKGYHQEGGDVVCNNCGKYFAIDDIGTRNTPGGCWPSFLSHIKNGDAIYLSKSELAKGSYRFA